MKHTTPHPDPTRPTSLPTHLWSVDTVARYLDTEPDEVYRLLETDPALPRPIRIGGRMLWHPDAWPTFADVDRPGATSEPRHDHLWGLAELVTFLNLSENTVRKLLGTADDVPAAVVECRTPRWDPHAWWQWAADRSADTSEVGALAGTKTRV